MALAGLAIACGVLTSWPLLYPAPERVLPIANILLVCAMGLLVLGFIRSGASLIRKLSFQTAHSDKQSVEDMDEGIQHHLAAKHARR